jgi:hypothetical protein
VACSANNEGCTAASACEAQKTLKEFKEETTSGQTSCSGYNSSSGWNCLVTPCDGRQRKDEGWLYCLENSTGGNCQYCRPVSATAKAACTPGEIICGTAASGEWYQYIKCQEDKTWSKLQGTENDTNKKCLANKPAVLPSTDSICPKSAAAGCKCNEKSGYKSATTTVGPGETCAYAKKSVQVDCSDFITRATGQDSATAECKNEACHGQENTGEGWYYCSQETGTQGQCKYCRVKTAKTSAQATQISCGEKATKLTNGCVNVKCDGREYLGSWYYCKEGSANGSCTYCPISPSTSAENETKKDTTAISQQVSCAGMINNASEFICPVVKCDNRENGAGGWTYCIEGSSGGNCRYCQRRAIDLKPVAKAAQCKPGVFRCGKEADSELWFKYQNCQLDGTWGPLTGAADDTKCPATLSFEAGKINKCKEGDRSVCGEGGCGKGQQRLCEGGQLSSCVRSDACAAQVQQVTESQSCANLKQLSAGESSKGRFVGCSGKKNCFCNSANKVVCYDDTDHNSCAAAGSDTPVKTTVDVQVTGKPATSPSITDVINKAVDTVKNAWDSLVNSAGQKKKVQDKAVSDVQAARDEVLTNAKKNSVTLQADGGVCATGGDCQSGFCKKDNGRGICTRYADLKNDGETCSNQSQCKSGKCDNVCGSGNYAQPQIVPGQKCNAASSVGQCVCHLADGSIKNIKTGTLCIEDEWAGCSVDSQCADQHVCQDIYDAGYHMRKCVPYNNVASRCKSQNQTFCPVCLADNPQIGDASNACVNPGETCANCLLHSSPATYTACRVGTPTEGYPTNSCVIGSGKIYCTILGFDSQLRKSVAVQSGCIQASSCNDVVSNLRSQGKCI